MHLYLLCILAVDKFDCLCSLGDSDSNIADISNEWSYSFILRDVEWIDLRVFREIIWSEISHLKSIGISWSNGTIGVHGTISLHFKIFSLVMQLYFKNYIKECYMNYDILVRYETLYDVRVQTYCDRSCDIPAKVISKLSPKSKCLLQ